MEVVASLPMLRVRRGLLLLCKFASSSIPVLALGRSNNVGMRARANSMIGPVALMRSLVTRTLIMESLFASKLQWHPDLLGWRYDGLILGEACWTAMELGYELLFTDV